MEKRDSKTLSGESKMFGLNCQIWAPNSFLVHFGCSKNTLQLALLFWFLWPKLQLIFQIPFCHFFKISLPFLSGILYCQNM